MNSSNRWIWTLIQGILAAGLGLWALLDRNSVLSGLSYAAAIYVAIAGGIQTLRALLNWGQDDASTQLVRGLIGLIGGVIVLLMSYFTDTPVPTIVTILAIVLIAYGVMGLFSTIFARGGRPFEWPPVLVNALMIFLGVLVFVDKGAQDTDLMLWSSIILIVAGAAMILYALTRQRGHTEVSTAV